MKYALLLFVNILYSLLLIPSSAYSSYSEHGTKEYRFFIDESHQTSFVIYNEYVQNSEFQNLSTQKINLHNGIIQMVDFPYAEEPCDIEKNLDLMLTPLTFKPFNRYHTDTFDQQCYTFFENQPLENLEFISTWYELLNINKCIRDKVSLHIAYKKFADSRSKKELSQVKENIFKRYNIEKELFIYDYLLRFDYTLLHNNNETLDLPYWNFSSDDTISTIYNTLSKLRSLPGKNLVKTIIIDSIHYQNIKGLRKEFPALSNIYVKKSLKYKDYLSNLKRLLYDCNNRFNPLTMYLPNTINEQKKGKYNLQNIKKTNLTLYKNFRIRGVYLVSWMLHALLFTVSMMLIDNRYVQYSLSGVLLLETLTILWALDSDERLYNPLVNNKSKLPPLITKLDIVLTINLLLLLLLDIGIYSPLHIFGYLKISCIAQSILLLLWFVPFSCMQKSDEKILFNLLFYKKELVQFDEPFNK